MNKKIIKRIKKIFKSLPKQEQETNKHLFDDIKDKNTVELLVLLGDLAIIRDEG